jgi:hypothetical protein
MAASLSRLGASVNYDGTGGRGNPSRNRDAEAVAAPLDSQT